MENTNTLILQNAQVNYYLNSKDDKDKDKATISFTDFFGQEVIIDLTTEQLKKLQILIENDLKTRMTV